MQTKKVKLSVETLEKLKRLGSIGSSYNDVINGMITFVNTNDEYWNSERT